MTEVRTTTRPPTDARSVARPSTGGQVVLSVPATALTSAAAVADVATVGGLPVLLVRTLVARGLDVPVSGLIPTAVAEARLATLRAAVPSARVLTEAPASQGWGRALGLAAGSAAALALGVTSWMLGAGAAPAGALLGLSALLAGLAVGSGADRLASPDPLSALRALEEARAGLGAGPAAWEAVGGLRRALAELDGDARAELAAALDATEARLAAGDPPGPLLQQVQEAHDALVAPARLRPQQAPQLGALARAARAAKDELAGR